MSLSCLACGWRASGNYSLCAVYAIIINCEVVATNSLAVRDAITMIIVAVVLMTLRLFVSATTSTYSSALIYFLLVH